MTIHDLYTKTHNPERQILPAGFMIHMPSKGVTKEELYELKTHMDFNPLSFYPSGVRKRRDEVGHDQCYRYILEDL